MKVKVCFENETHKISSTPPSLQAFSELISSLFIDQIPTNHYLEYIDSEGDKIIIFNEDDYQEFLETLPI